MALLPIEDFDAVNFPNPGRKDAAYSAAEVDNFRAIARESLVEAYSFNQELSERLDEAEAAYAELEAAPSVTSDVKDSVTLLSHAQTIANEVTATAEANAAKVTADAATQATELIARAQAEVSQYLTAKKAEHAKLTSEVNALKVGKAKTLAQLEALFAETLVEFKAGLK